MDDSISRQAAIEEAEAVIRINGYSNIALVAETNRLIGRLMRLPAAKVFHGKWEEKWQPIFKAELPCCSVCNNLSVFRWSYCPNCGAKMDEGSQNE